MEFGVETDRLWAELEPGVLDYLVEFEGMELEPDWEAGRKGRRHCRSRQKCEWF